MKLTSICIILLECFVFCSQEEKTERGKLSSFIRNLKSRMQRQREIAVENYSDDNFRLANETNIEALAGKPLREADFRLPYLFPWVVKAQKEGNEFPLESFYRSVVWIWRHNHNPIERERAARKYQKVQEEIPASVPFPCNVTGGRSKERPTSVNKVRPGDIDLIVAFGDSLTLGTGLKASNQNHFLHGDNEVSPFIGGAKTWREYMTLPNILKEFNPNLYGYMEKPSVIFTFLHEPHYNLAIHGAVMDDMITMAERYVKKVKSDPRVNFEKDWKMISIMTGALDFCLDICYWRNPYNSIAHTKKTLYKLFDYLMENSPRTIINFIPFLNTKKLIDQQKDVSPHCSLHRPLWCPCFYADVFNETALKHQDLIEHIIKAQIEVANDPKYREKEDFAVLQQPVTRNIKATVRVTSSGETTTDWRDFAPDCFHLSQRGMSKMANAIWNSLLTPYHKKNVKINQKLLEEFRCPTEDNPYISTYWNSDNI